MIDVKRQAKFQSISLTILLSRAGVYIRQTTYEHTKRGNWSNKRGSDELRRTENDRWQRNFDGDEQTDRDRGRLWPDDGY